VKRVRGDVPRLAPGTPATRLLPHDCAKDMPDEVECGICGWHAWPDEEWCELCQSYGNVHDPELHGINDFNVEGQPEFNGAFR